MMDEVLTLERIEGTARQMLPEAAAALAEPWGPEADWRPGLEALLRSLRDEAQLGLVRPHMTLQTLAALLASRSATTLLRRAAPQRFETPVEAPVFVTGLPRSGTTLLHNLLATHPDHRAHPLWRLRGPARSLLTPSQEVIGETERMLAVLHQLAPEFVRIHPLHALRPDECNWAFRPAFQTLVLAFQFYVPSYLQWMLDTPQFGVYRQYREQLGVLESVSDTSGRLVLKDPCHLWHLDALFEAFPDAKVLVLNRDPASVLPSFGSLCFSLQSMSADFDDRAATGRYCVKMAKEGLRRLAEARERYGASIVDVDYAELVADPIGTVNGICTALGSRRGAAIEDRVEDWLEDNRQHKAGRHRYTLDDFGIGEDAVAEVRALELLGR